MLHTRISEQLSDDIRRLADDLRVPTSNLVRNVLEEVFTMVESVSEDVGELFEDVLDEAQEARERVRRRADRQRVRNQRGPEESASARGEGFDQAVERELRRDESSEHDTPGPSNDAADGRPEQQGTHAAQTRPDFSDVLGWQPLVLNHERTCAGCGVTLHRGAHAYIGLGKQGLSDTTVCRACAGTRD